MSGRRTRILVVFGTRPEAIKIAPVIAELRRRPQLETLVCVTAQHREMLDQVLSLFSIAPDFDLDVMREAQSLDQLTAGVLTRLGGVLDEVQPDRTIVHGDTTTTFAGALASYYRRIPVGHVEAGLRTGNVLSPWPEEMNRRAVDSVSDLLWAPTENAAAALLREGASPRNILVTGNTVIDALQQTAARLRADPQLAAQALARTGYVPAGRRMILVTGHRRENFDGGLAELCRALNRLAERPDVDIVWPVHPNPNVGQAIREGLGDRANVRLIPPQDYLSFVTLMQQSCFIITDSGGIQEEAPSLGKPVLVARDTTERPEAVTAGTARLVGADADSLYAAATALLDDAEQYDRMASALNPFGDGQAATRIADSVIARHATKADRAESRAS